MLGVVRLEAISGLDRGAVAPGVRAAGEDDRLLGLLAALPLAQREVIARALLGRLSQEDIAAELALPVDMVRGRMRLGLSELRARVVA